MTGTKFSKDFHGGLFLWLRNDENASGHNWVDLQPIRAKNTCSSVVDVVVLVLFPSRAQYGAPLVTTSPVLQLNSHEKYVSEYILGED